MKKKNPALLIAGAALFVAGVLLCFVSYRGSYAQSKEKNAEITEIKAAILDTEKALADLEGESPQKEALSEKLDALNAQSAALSKEKLALEKPYSFSLFLLIFGVILLVSGAVSLLSKAPKENGTGRLLKLAQAGLMAALCYIGFAFFKIDIPVGTEKTAFHLGNVFCVLAALLLGGFWGGMAGAVGMTIGDLTTAYVTSAPKTFVLKLCIGLIVGLVAHKIFKIGRHTNRKYVAGITVLSSFCGMAFNVAADPLIGYLYKTYLLGIPQDLSKALAKLAALTSFVNALVAVLCASVFYLALRPALKKAGLLATEQAR